MSDENADPNDTRPTGDPVPPTFDSAAVGRARDAIRDVISTPTAVPEAVSGAMIGQRYKLLELIGEGGMGVVWMAEQRSPVKRLVAIKLIKAGMDSSAVLARFDAERQALAMMDHPNIARVFDGGTTDRGHPYFVMELVKGLPLTKYCDQRRMSVHERLDLFVQVCAAVQHAHQKGIIHRDLKPANLLVTEHDGKPVPKVIDFGLAKALGGSSVLTDHTLHTSFGAAAGTPHYMAPEQVAINALDVDTRADIYALGVILYELLAGSTPHELKQLHQVAWDEVRRVIGQVEPPRPSLRITQSATLVNLAASRQTEPARLSKLVAGELDWIVMKALEKDRHRRYGTASDLAADLQRHLTGEPVLAAPPTAMYRLQKIVRKHKVAISTVAVLFVVLFAGVVVSSWQAIRASRAEMVAHNETIEVQKQKSEAGRQKIEAQLERDIAIKANSAAEAAAAIIHRQLADSYIEAGIAAWKTKTPEVAALWFAEALKLDQGDVHRERADRIRLNDSFARCPRLLDLPLPDMTTYCNGKLAVQSGVWSLTKSNDAAPQDLEFSKWLKSVGNTAKLNPDQKLILGRNDGVVQVWDVVTEEPVGPPIGKTLPNHPADGYIDQAYLDPDGHRVAILSNGKLQIVNVTTGKPISTSIGDQLRCAAFSSDGKLIATGDSKGSVLVYESATAHQIFTGTAGEKPVTSLEFNSLGTFILMVNGHVTVFELDDGASAFDGEYASFSPDGRFVAGANPLQLVEISTKKTKWTLDSSNADVNPIFSPDGKKILLIDSAGGIARVYDAANGHAITAPMHNVGATTDAAFAPDGQSVVTQTESGITRLWDATPGQPLESLNFRLRSSSEPEGAQFIQNGNLLLIGTGSPWVAKPAEPFCIRCVDALTGQSMYPPIISYEGEWINFYPYIIFQNWEHFLSTPQRYIVRLVDDQTARVWDTYTGLPVEKWVDPDFRRLSSTDQKNMPGITRFSPDGKLAFHAGKEIHIWDVATGRRVGATTAPVLPTVALTFDMKFLPNSIRVLSATRSEETGDLDEVTVWDVLTGKRTGPSFRAPPNTVSAMLNTDADVAVTIDSDQSMQSWNVETGQPCPLPPDAYTLFKDAYSPDGKTFIREGRAFDTATNKPLMPLMEGFFDRWSYAPKGDLLESHMDRGTSASVWDITQIKPVVAPLEFNNLISADLSPNGNKLATADLDGFRVIPIESVEYPIAEVQQLAEVLSASQLDEAGGLAPLKPDEYAIRWNHLREKFPSMFQMYVPPPPREIAPSYRNNIEARVAGSTTDQAKRDLAREFALAGKMEINIGFYKEAALLEETALALDGSLLSARDHLAHADACLGRFPEALAIYKQLVGQEYHTDAPWKDDGNVGDGVLDDIAKLWPADTDPIQKQILALNLPAAESDTAQSDDDVYTESRLAIQQFKAGDIQNARNSLRKAVKAGTNVADDSDEGRLLFSAKSLIDPPSTQPTDSFSDGLNAAADAVVSQPRQPQEKYAYALELAQHSVAASTQPGNLNTLAMAQFRMGDFKGALKSIAQSEAADFVAQDNHNANLILTAMVQQALGQHVQARKTLQQVIDASNDSNDLDDEDTQLLNEAAALIDPASTQPATQPTTAP